MILRSFYGFFFFGVILKKKHLFWSFWNIEGCLGLFEGHLSMWTKLGSYFTSWDQGVIFDKSTFFWSLFWGQFLGSNSFLGFSFRGTKLGPYFLTSNLRVIFGHFLRVIFGQLGILKVISRGSFQGNSLVLWFRAFGHPFW